MIKDSEMYEAIINVLMDVYAPKDRFAMIHWLMAKYDEAKRIEEYLEAKEAAECAANAE